MDVALADAVVRVPEPAVDGGLRNALGREQARAGMAEGVERRPGDLRAIQ